LGLRRKCRLLVASTSPIIKEEIEEKGEFLFIIQKLISSVLPVKDRDLSRIIESLKAIPGLQRGFGTTRVKKKLLNEPLLHMVQPAVVQKVKVKVKKK